jgi:two-component system response regulator DegU
MLTSSEGAIHLKPTLQIKIFLLVGNHLLCESLARIIQHKTDIEVTEQSNNLSNIALAIARSECDVILLDSVGANALSCQRVTRLRDLNPRAQVLVVGMEADDGAFLRAVRAGVSGYLLNEASALDVIAAIRAIVRGEAVCPFQLCRTLFDTVSGKWEYTPSIRKMGFRLTRREQELLPMIANGLSNKEIASRLNLSQQTVKNHIHRMFRKVGANDRLEVIEIAGAESLRN